MIRLWHVAFLALWLLDAYCEGFSVWGVALAKFPGSMSPMQGSTRNMAPCHQHWRSLQATSSEADPVLQTHNVTVDNNKPQTLYDILDASPLATRAELRKRYHYLATILHPDANIGNHDEDSDNKDNTHINTPPKRLFSEVSAAWSILRDPRSRKQYDRQLWLQQWSDVVSSYTNHALEGAVPFVSKLVDTVAIPMMVTTATTTVAISQAVSQHMPSAWKRKSPFPLSVEQQDSQLLNQTNATTTTDDMVPKSSIHH